MAYPTVDEYTQGQLEACNSVLLELSRILGAYWENIAIVGGWVPTLLANNPADPHKGTMDIDLALNHPVIPDGAYEKIHELLTGHNYVQNTDKAKQFQYFRTIAIDGQEYKIAIDLLTGEYDVETGKGRRHEPVQDVMALKARGVDLVFGRYEVVTISGSLPNEGGKYSVDCKVAGVAPIIVMKSIVIQDRYKDKDAYDLYYFVRHRRGGVKAILETLTPDINNGMVKEAVEILQKHFASIDASGPASIARFLQVSDEERPLLMRDACETIQSLLSGIEQLQLEHISASAGEGAS